MGVEYEWKFRATPEILQAIDRAVPGESCTYRMQTTYYDTPEEALSQRHYTLRTRLENGTSVCTLKAPLKGFGRGEWDLVCEDIQAAIPELCKLGGPAELMELTAGGVKPICGARFTRIAKTVELDDCVLELALDQGVLTGGERELPLCEVEVELKTGEPARCDAYARQLAVAFELKPEKKSKFRRGFALYKGE